MLKDDVITVTKRTVASTSSTHSSSGDKGKRSRRRDRDGDSGALVNTSGHPGCQLGGLTLEELKVGHQQRANKIHYLACTTSTDHPVDSRF